MIRPRSLLLPMMALLFVSLTARGGTIVSNLSEPAGLFSPVAVTSDTFWAQQFTVGADPAELTGIVVQIGNLDLGRSGDFSMLATLVSTTSASDFPDQGTLLSQMSFTLADIPTSGFANVLFTPTAPLALNPGLFYWFTLTGSSSDDSGEVDWQYTDSTSTTGPGSLTGVGRYDVPGPWGVGDTGSLSIDVQGTVVPEPASWIMGMMGLFSVAGVSRRLGRRRASL